MMVGRELALRVRALDSSSQVTFTLYWFSLGQRKNELKNLYLVLLLLNA